MPFIDPPELPNFISEQFPFERGSYTLASGQDQGRVIHFVDHGARDGQVVLMFHGNPTWSFLWRKVIALLPAERYRCVAPDLLGFGCSSKLPSVSDHCIDRHVDALVELIEALDLQNIILVGQDWGGPMVTCVGARISDRVSAVVFGNTSVLVPKRPRGTAFHRFARLPIISDLVFRGLGFPQSNLGIAQGDPGSIRGNTARSYKWPLRRLADRAAPLAMARMVPDSPEHPSVPALRRGLSWIESFEGPTALVWGQKDPILGRALKRHIELLAHASVRRTEAGHFLQEEVPDQLADAISEVFEAVQAQ